MRHGGQGDTVRGREASRAAQAAGYEGLTAAEWAERLRVPQVALYDAVPSTMDVAHAVAADGGPAGTLVIADRQTAGRGRGGNVWRSPAGSWLWLTLIERPTDGAAIAVLALRVALGVARALRPFAATPVGVKWPNDVYAGTGKVAGILAEARWQDQQPLWVAIGLGINLEPPAEIATAAGLRAGTERGDVLAAVVPYMRAAAAGRGPLSDSEMAALAASDIGRGRRCRAPVPGRVLGITAAGELLVATSGGLETCRSGSLVFDDIPEGG